MKINFELTQDIKDVTGEFKQKLFYMKTAAVIDRLTAHALQHVTYMTTLYTISNKCLVAGKEVEFKTQCTDEINNYSIKFLN